jgi:DNA-binding GntR family transcriptional regulator
MPRYKEITENLLQRLRCGEWPIGEPFPSIAMLQDEYKVAGLNTIRQALSPLRDAGYIVVQQGRRPYVEALPEQDHNRTVDVLTQLLAARRALDAAINALKNVA